MIWPKWLQLRALSEDEAPGGVEERLVHLKGPTDESQGHQKNINIYVDMKLFFCFAQARFISRLRALNICSK